MYADKPLAILAVAIIAYLLGSVSGAITASRLFHKTDIRKYGSGNAGMTNALRTFGAKTAVWVSAVDALKTVAALLIGRWLVGDLAVVVAGSGAVLGHAFPVYYSFKGGKCVLASAVILLFMDWRVFLCCVAVFLALAALTKIVAVGSLGATGIAPVLTWFFLKDPIHTAFVACLAIFVAVLHRGNIKRIIEKRELKPTKGDKQ